MVATCTKHRTILQFRTDDLVRREVTFEQEEVDGWRTIQSFVMDRESWIDLGQPQVITVSVEPGDLLNEEA